MKNILFVLRILPYAIFLEAGTLFATTDSTSSIPLEKMTQTISQPTQTQTTPVNSVEKMRQDALKLRAEAKALREMADTLDKSSDDAENKAHEVVEKADNVTKEITESESQKVARLVHLEMARIKRAIQVDIERIKKLHGNANDSVYVLQADSLDSLLGHISKDTTPNITKQNELLDEIHSNSKALLEKSREMSLKARELEESADKREDMAEELTEKADKLAEEQNPLPLSKRFPLHVGFQIRITEIGSLYSQRADFLLLHGMNITYSATQHFEAGIQDIAFYWQETFFGSRFAITASPVIKASFFPVKRLLVGCAAGATFENRFGAQHEARLSTVPFVSVYNEFWVRNHFSISPVLRYNYAMYGPAYTIALSQHSGVLPQKASWLDFGIGYNFNF